MRPRKRSGEAISIAFVECADNEIVAERMNKKQRMRCNRAAVQPFLDLPTAVLKGTVGSVFRRHCPSFRLANDEHVANVVAAQ